jgi:restriction endonuclease S subunit
MFNINNKNLISFGIALFAIIALNILVFIPTSAKAYYHVGWENGNYVGYSVDSGNNNGNTNYTNDNPIPTISSISPDSARLNSNVTITVIGHDFVQGAIVKFDGADRPTTFVNSSTLRAQLSYSDLNNKGDYLITVLNPIPGGGLSNAVLFSVNNNYVAPVKASTVKNNSTTNTTNTTNTTTNTVTTDKLNQSSDQAAGAIFGANAFMPSSLLQWFFFAILILLAIVLWRKLYVTESTPLKHA